MGMPTMQDSVSASALTPGADAYAGYVDGRWPSFGAIVKRFYPGAHCISITTLGRNARIADCERGDLSVEAAAWWLAHRVPTSNGGMWTPERGTDWSIPLEWRPGVYIQESKVSGLVAALAELVPALHRSAWVLWVARWQAHRPVHLPAGWDAWQWFSDAVQNVDYSVCGPNMLRGTPTHMDNCS